MLLKDIVTHTYRWEQSHTQEIIDHVEQTKKVPFFIEEMRALVNQHLEQQK